MQEDTLLVCRNSNGDNSAEHRLLRWLSLKRQDYARFSAGDVEDYN